MEGETAGELTPDAAQVEGWRRTVLQRAFGIGVFAFAVVTAMSVRVVVASGDVSRLFPLVFGLVLMGIGRARPQRPIAHGVLILDLAIYASATVLLAKNGYLLPNAFAVFMTTSVVSALLLDGWRRWIPMVAALVCAAVGGFAHTLLDHPPHVEQFVLQPNAFNWTRVLITFGLISTAIVETVSLFQGKLFEQLERNAKESDRLDDATRRAEAMRVELAETREAVAQTELSSLLGRLAGEVSHDLNNTMTVIVGAATMLELALEEQDEEEFEELTGLIDTSARQAVEMCKELLPFSGDEYMNVQHVDANALAERVARSAKLLLPRGVTVSTELAEDAAQFMGDEASVERVLLNLVTNARDALERGGHLAIRVRAPADQVCIEVRDDGSGIAPEILDHVFDPFFTTKEEGRGTGLGLANARKLLHELGGEIELESTVGEGTTAKVSLPASPTGQRRRGVVSAELPSQLSILLVDDELLVRFSLAESLSRAGHDVVDAVDGAHALRRFDAEPDRFDVVISDVQMPVLDGIDLLEALATRAPELPVLLMTGNVDAIASRGEIQPDRILHKPCSSDDLLRAIAQLNTREAGS